MFGEFKMAFSWPFGSTHSPGFCPALFTTPLPTDVSSLLYPCSSYLFLESNLTVLRVRNGACHSWVISSVPDGTDRGHSVILSWQRGWSLVCAGLVLHKGGWKVDQLVLWAGAPPCGFAARQPQGRRTSYLVGSRQPEWEFQQTRWKLAWYDLASNVQWCPFCHILLVGALTNPLRFRGRDTDPLSQWERWKRTCGPVWTHVGFFCRLWS